MKVQDDHKNKRQILQENCNYNKVQGKMVTLLLLQLVGLLLQNRVVLLQRINSGLQKIDLV